MVVGYCISFISMHVDRICCAAAIGDSESMFILHAHMCEDTSEGDSQAHRFTGVHILTQRFVWHSTHNETD